MRLIVTVRHVLLAALATAPVFVVPSVFAGPVIGYGEGSFASLSSCDNVGPSQDCRIVNSSNGAATQVQWGSQSSRNDFVNPSTLTAVDVSFNTFTPTTVQLARLDWYNSATLRKDSSLDVFAVNYKMAVHFDAPTGLDPNGNELFNFTIKNPLNPTGDSIYGFDLSDLSNLRSSVTLSGVTLSNFRYSVTDGAGIGTSWIGGNRWYNDEYNNSRLSILADVTAVASPIPEPETYAMLLAGLGLLGFETRRRKQL
jgi:hypothetical protein